MSPTPAVGACHMNDIPLCFSVAAVCVTASPVALQVMSLLAPSEPARKVPTGSVRPMARACRRKPWNVAVVGSAVIVTDEKVFSY